MKLQQVSSSLIVLGLLCGASSAGAEVGGTIHFSGIECVTSQEFLTYYSIGTNGFLNFSNGPSMSCICPFSGLSHDSTPILRNIQEVRVYYTGPAPFGWLTYRGSAGLGLYYVPLQGGFFDTFTGAPMLKTTSSTRMQTVEAGMQLELTIGSGTTILGGGASMTSADVSGGI